MLIATASSIAAIGVMLWLLFTLTVYVLPFYAGTLAGFWAYQHGAGPLGAFAVGLFSAALTLGVGQVLRARLQSPWARAAVATIYIAPAGVAGFHAVHGLSGLSGADETWRVTFACLGGAVIAGLAWMQVSALGPIGPERGEVALAVASPRAPVGASNDP